MQLSQISLQKVHQKVNQIICQFFSTLVGTMILYLFLTSFKDICESLMHQKVNQKICHLFFNSGGNNDILSFFNLIYGYLRKLHQKVIQMICQHFQPRWEDR